MKTKLYRKYFTCLKKHFSEFSHLVLTLFDGRKIFIFNFGSDNLIPPPILRILNCNIFRFLWLGPDIRLCDYRLNLALKN